MKIKNGFTLIEVMIAVVVVAILAAIALPNYNDYVRRGKIGEATATLADMRVKFEQLFQDNRTYNTTGALLPCQAGVGPVPRPANPKYFAFTCTGLSATAFLITATGNAAQGMGGFTYTVNQANTQVSVMAAPATTAGYNSNTNCWVVRRGAANSMAACQ